MKTHSDNSRNKTLYASQIAFAILFFAFIVEKIVLPPSDDGLTQSPILVLFTLLAVYIFGAITLGIYGYYSWKFDAIQLHDWRAAQEIFFPKWLQERREGVSKDYALWASHIGCALGFFFSSFMIYIFTQVIKAVLLGS